MWDFHMISYFPMQKATHAFFKKRHIIKDYAKTIDPMKGMVKLQSMVITFFRFYY